jgi:hypothetical protein
VVFCFALLFVVIILIIMIIGCACLPDVSTRRTLLLRKHCVLADFERRSGSLGDPSS